MEDDEASDGERESVEGCSTVSESLDCDFCQQLLQITVIQLNKLITGLKCRNEQLEARAEDVVGTHRKQKRRKQALSDISTERNYLSADILCAKLEATISFLLQGCRHSAKEIREKRLIAYAVAEYNADADETKNAALLLLMLELWRQVYCSKERAGGEQFGKAGLQPTGSLSNQLAVECVFPAITSSSTILFSVLCLRCTSSSMHWFDAVYQAIITEQVLLETLDSLLASSTIATAGHSMGWEWKTYTFLATLLSGELSDGFHQELRDQLLQKWLVVIFFLKGWWKSYSGSNAGQDSSAAYLSSWGHVFARLLTGMRTESRSETLQKSMEYLWLHLDEQGLSSNLEASLSSASLEVLVGFVGVCRRIDVTLGSVAAVVQKSPRWWNLLYHSLRKEMANLSSHNAKMVLYLLKYLTFSNAWSELISDMKSFAGSEVHLIQATLTSFLARMDNHSVLGRDVEQTPELEPSSLWKRIALGVLLHHSNLRIRKTAVKVILRHVASVGRVDRTSWCTVELLTSEMLPVLNDSSFFRLGRQANGQPSTTFDLEDVLRGLFTNLSEAGADMTHLIKAVLASSVEHDLKTPLIVSLLEAISQLPPTATFQEKDAANLRKVLSRIARDLHSPTLRFRAQRGLCCALEVAMKHLDLQTMSFLEALTILAPVEELIITEGYLWKHFCGLCLPDQDAVKDSILARFASLKIDGDVFAQASMLFLFPEVASKVCKPRVRGLFIDDPEQWATFLMKVIVRCNSFVPGCLTSGYLSAKEVTMMIQQAHVILSNPNERDASKMTLCIKWLATVASLPQRSTVHELAEDVLQNASTILAIKLAGVSDLELLGQVLEALTNLPAAFLEKELVSEYLLNTKVSFKGSSRFLGSFYQRKWSILSKLATFNLPAQSVLENYVEDVEKLDDAMLLDALLAVGPSFVSTILPNSRELLQECTRSQKLLPRGCFEEEAINHVKEHLELVWSSFVKVKRPSLLAPTVVRYLFRLEFTLVPELLEDGGVLKRFWRALLSMAESRPSILIELATFFAEKLWLIIPSSQAIWREEILDLLLYRHRMEPFEAHDRLSAPAANQAAETMGERSYLVSYPRILANLVLQQTPFSRTHSIKPWLIQQLLKADGNNELEVQKLLPNSDPFFTRVFIWQSLLLIIDENQSRECSESIWKRGVVALTSGIPPEIRHAIELTLAKSIHLFPELLVAVLLNPLSSLQIMTHSLLIQSFLTVLIEVVHAEPLVIELTREIKQNIQVVEPTLISFACSQNSIIRSCAQHLLLSLLHQGLIILQPGTKLFAFYDRLQHDIITAGLVKKVMRGRTQPFLARVSVESVLISNQNIFGEALEVPTVTELKRSLATTVEAYYASLERKQVLDVLETSVQHPVVQQVVLQEKVDPWNILEPGSAFSKNLNRSSVILIGSLVTRAPNLGGLCRTAEIFGAQKLVVGDKRVLKTKAFRSASVEAEGWIQVDEVAPNELMTYLFQLRKQGCFILGLEQTSTSRSLLEFSFPQNQPICVLLGTEAEGIPPDLLQCTDACVEIPQFGITRSLNVHVSGSLLLWEYVKQVHAINPE